MDEILTPDQWNELKNELKQLYPQLSDTDLPYCESVETDMLYMVECQLQKMKEESHRTTCMPQSFFSFERLMAI